MQNLSVVSWNIAFGHAIERAIADFASHSELATPDVVLLQEMDEEGTARIAEALSANYAYTSARAHDRTGRDFGNAVLSRWPILETAEVPLPHEAPVSGHPRSATYATIDAPGFVLSCYSVHTEVPLLSLAKRTKQFEVVAAHVAQQRADHVVVGGDFNTASFRGVQALGSAMQTAGLERASSEAEATFRRGGKRMKLDHIYTGGFVSQRAQAITGTLASDHLPLRVDLHRTT